MATLKKNWADTNQHDWNDDTWTTGAPTTAVETLSGVTESLTGSIDLVTNGYEGIQVTFDINFDGSPTDDVDVNVYGSIDGSNWDDVPLFSIRVDNGTDPSQLSLIVKDVAYCRIGFVQTGSTDSHDISTVYYKAWNYTDS